MKKSDDTLSYFGLPDSPVKPTKPKKKPYRRVLPHLHNPICPYCGKEEESNWSEYEEYYECNCKDAKKLRLINDKIRELEWSKPEPKFRVTQQDVVVGME